MPISNTSSDNSLDAVHQSCVALSHSSPQSCSLLSHWSMCFTLSFAHCSSALHLQYDVHGILADMQLHVALEHGLSDLQPHDTCCKSTFGATDTLPCIGTMMSSSLIHPNLERSSLGMLYSSAALQMSTWSRARLICSLAVSSVGGKFFYFWWLLRVANYSVS